MPASPEVLRESTAVGFQPGFQVPSPVDPGPGAKSEIPEVADIERAIPRLYKWSEARAEVGGVDKMLLQK